MSKINLSRRQDWLVGWLIIPAVLFLWEVIALRIGKPKIFPRISDIVNAFEFFLLNKDGYIYIDVIVSFIRALTGFFVGSLLGFLMGMLTARSRIAQYSLGRLFNFLRAVTPVALVSIAVLWFGIGEFAQVFLITWGVFFTVWVSVDLGINKVDERFIWITKTLRKNDKIEIGKVFLMSSFKVWLSGLRTGIGIAFILVFVGELAGATTGLGHRISIAYEIGRPDRVVAGLILLGGLGAVSNSGFNKLIYWSFPWIDES